MSKVITVCGRKYASDEAAFVGTLFETGGTAAGYFKAMKRGVLLMDMQRKPVAFVVVGKDAPYIVTAGGIAGGKHEGRTFYMQGLSMLTERALGLPPGDYRAEREEAARVLLQVRPADTWGAAVLAVGAL